MKKKPSRKKGENYVRNSHRILDAFSHFLLVTKQLGCERCYVALAASDVADWMVQLYHFSTCVSTNRLKD